jgi:WD40 repeat protein
MKTRTSLITILLMITLTNCHQADLGTVIPAADIPQATPPQILLPGESLIPTAMPDTMMIDPTLVCPPARGNGTISPAVSIYSITFRVNGLEQVVYAEGMLQAAPGGEIQIRDVTICAREFLGNGGEACVDFAPVDQSSREIMGEHLGTHIVTISPGFTTISNLEFTWTVSEDWSGMVATLNHWAAEKTQDLGCSSGRCERDDRITIGLQSPAAISVGTADQVELLSTLGGHNGYVTSLAISGDGTLIASASMDHTIKVWDISSGEVMHAFEIGDACLNNIAFSPDGRLLATSEAVWDVETRQIIHVFKQGLCAAVDFSPDGSMLAVANSNGPIMLWDISSWQLVRTLDNPNLSHDIAFSPDGSQLAVHREPNAMVKLWDVASGQLLRTFPQISENYIHGVAFSPDGTLLASAGADRGTTLVWSVATGQVLRTLPGNSCWDVGFSPDGSLITTSGCDSSVMLWDAASGRLVRTLQHGGEVMTVVFSPDGRLLASAGYDHHIYLWGLP